MEATDEAEEANEWLYSQGIDGVYIYFLLQPTPLAEIDDYYVQLTWLWDQFYFTNDLYFIQCSDFVSNTLGSSVAPCQE